MIILPGHPLLPLLGGSSLIKLFGSFVLWLYCGNNWLGHYSNSPPGTAPPGPWHIPCCLSLWVFSSHSPLPLLFSFPFLLMMILLRKTQLRHLPSQKPFLDLPSLSWVPPLQPWIYTWCMRPSQPLHTEMWLSVGCECVSFSTTWWCVSFLCLFPEFWSMGRPKNFFLVD